MRIITLNVNGLRPAAAKGFGAWMRSREADVVRLQQIRAREADLPRALLAPRCAGVREGSPEAAGAAPC